MIYSHNIWSEYKSMVLKGIFPHTIRCLIFDKRVVFNCQFPKILAYLAEILELWRKHFISCKSSLFSSSYRQHGSANKSTGLVSLQIFENWILPTNLDVSRL